MGSRRNYDKLFNDDIGFEFTRILSIADDSVTRQLVPTGLSYSNGRNCWHYNILGSTFYFRSSRGADQYPLDAQLIADDFVLYVKYDTIPAYIECKTDQAQKRYYELFDPMRIDLNSIAIVTEWRLEGKMDDLKTWLMLFKLQYR